METMYKCPQREAGESGGTEQQGSPGPSGRKRWWGQEKPVLLGPRTAGRVGHNTLLRVERVSTSLPSSSLRHLVTAAWTRGAHGLMKSPSPGPASSVSWMGARKTSISSSTASHGRKQPLQPTATAGADGNTRGTARTLLFDARHSGTSLYQLHSFLPLSPTEILFSPVTVFLSFPCWLR